MTATHETASTVFAEAGVVYVDGPGSVAYAMSIDAAVRTSDRLLAGAAAARGQQLTDHTVSKPKKARPSEID